MHQTAGLNEHDEDMPMPYQKLCRMLLGLSVLLNGCAHAYYDYPCGCVAYDYCPDPPLPYAAYSGCPTPIATRRSIEAPSPVFWEKNDSY